MIKKFILCIMLSFLFCGCEYWDNLFTKPEGKAEIASSNYYVYENVSYCDVNVKVTNVGKRNIYNSSVSVKTTSTKYEYYGTVTVPSVIPPGKSVYVTVNFMIVWEMDLEKKPNEPKRNENWRTNTSIIVEEFYE